MPFVSTTSDCAQLISVRLEQMGQISARLQPEAHCAMKHAGP